MRKNTSGAADQDQEHQPRSDLREGKGEMAMFLRIVRMACLNVGGVSGAAHFHQDKCGDGHHHEGGEGEQENALSTVRTAEASTIRNARIARVMWSRSLRNENMRTTTPNNAR